MRRRLVIFLLFLHSAVLIAAQTKTVENLVFEGAGIRGIAYAGVLSVLQEKGVLSTVKRVGGTSAGAITALLVSIGYNASEIRNIISGTDFRRFNDGGWFLAGGLHRLIRHFGWYRGQKLETWLGTLIKNKTGNADLTFAGAKSVGCKDLYITATSLTTQRTLVLSHENFPHMKLREAVRMSVTIPFYFEPLFMDDAGRVYRRPKKTQGLHLMLDGGFVANFPLRLFDSTRYFRTDTVNGFSLNPHTLGFRIDRDLQIAYDKAEIGLAPMPVQNSKQYVIAFYNLVLESLNRQMLQPEDWRRTVSVSDGGVGPRIRRLKNDEINLLMENGRRSTNSFLQAR